MAQKTKAWGEDSDPTERTRTPPAGFYARPMPPAAPTAPRLSRAGGIRGEAVLLAALKKSRKRVFWRPKGTQQCLRANVAASAQRKVSAARPLPSLPFSASGNSELLSVRQQKGVPKTKPREIPETERPAVPKHKANLLHADFFSWNKLNSASSLRFGARGKKKQQFLFFLFFLRLPLQQCPSTLPT